MMESSEIKVIIFTKDVPLYYTVKESLKKHAWYRKITSTIEKSLEKIIQKHLL